MAKKETMIRNLCTLLLYYVVANVHELISVFLIIGGLFHKLIL